MRILLLNQAYHPDVVSTAQHATDIAEALVAHGHEVTVIASRRAYDDPARQFPAKETRGGVRVLRVRCSGYGKSARWRRAADFATFLGACMLRLLELRRQDVVIGMTTPPLVSFLAALFVRVKGGRLVSWVMDLNPDQAIAAGWMTPRSGAARILARLLRFSLASSDSVIVLDRFMKERIAGKGVDDRKVVVIPPWTHDTVVGYDEDARRKFRAEHGLEGKFVVMYSGNHSPCHPLDTLLEAARVLRDRQDIRFCFIGGGSEFPSVGEFGRKHGLSNIICLPYQPLSALSGSLSSGDLHVITMGDPFVGIVHPCKIYNVLALDLPFLYIGPQPSHITEMMPNEHNGAASFARHGEVDCVVSRILSAAAAPPLCRNEHRRIAALFSHATLVPRMISIVHSLNVGCARSPFSVSTDQVR